MKALITLVCALIMTADAVAEPIPAKEQSQAALLAVCLDSPGNSRESCVCGVDQSARSLDDEQLAILAFMAAEMQKLESDEELFLTIIRRFSLSPERFHEAITAINRASAEAKSRCERIPPQAAAN